jgi:peptide alpha-N-acetyltransferase
MTVALPVICPLQVGDQFTAAANAYCQKFLLRGIPSLFSDLKPLYADTTKAATLQQLFTSYTAALQSSGSLPPLLQGDGSSSTKAASAANGPASQPHAAAANGGSDSSSSGEDNPLTWVLHYLSQHYDKLGDQERALQLNQQALDLAPSVIELLLARARFLKHAGAARHTLAAAVGLVWGGGWGAVGAEGGG